jgi:hypothetical protein
MARVAIKSGHGPVTVEGFPEDAERSCEGALHLYPGQYRDVSDDELEHIRKGAFQIDVIEDAPVAAEAPAAEETLAPGEFLGTASEDEAAAEVPKRKRSKKSATE